ISNVVNIFPEPPVPLLQLKSSWLELFPSEKVELTCFISGSSDWNFIWYRDGTEIQSADPNLSADQSVLTITAATQMYSGKYACKGQHKIKGVTTQISNSLEVKVHVQPKPTLIRDPNFDMFPGESVTFTCMVSVFSEWDYLWYHNGNKIKELKTNTYTIASIAHSNSGQYHCKAKRGTGPFYTQESDKISLQISDRNPAVKLTRNPEYKVMFTRESVSFNCFIDLSSGWEYLWYKDSTQINAASVNMYQISTVGTSDTGLYKCQAKRGSNQFFKTESSQSIHLEVQETPVPSLEQSTQWLDVFPHEPVNLTCGIKGSSDWMYTWYKDGQQIQADKTVSFDLDKTSLSISSASPSHRGQYSCRGQLKRSSVISKVSLGLTNGFFVFLLYSLFCFFHWLLYFHYASLISCFILCSYIFHYASYIGCFTD
uniref:Ig-like domain-containing protein n=1 Tax=Monopterus albus TaxID=43700 RepID=A0A3Q3JJ02_MONAL